MPREINPYCSICGVLKTPYNTARRKKGFQSECNVCKSIIQNSADLQSAPLDALYKKIDYHRTQIDRIIAVIQNPDMKPRDIAKLLRGKS
jgi:hypothetical protein